MARWAALSMLILIINPDKLEASLSLMTRGEQKMFLDLRLLKSVWKQGLSQD